MSLTNKVELGAVWLDDNIPGWRRLINKPLSMNDNRLCIGGQLCGDYFTFRKQYGLTPGESVQLGFASWREVDNPKLAPDEYKKLTVEWLKQIEKRMII